MAATLSPQEIAEKSAAAMMSLDHASRALKIQVVAIAPGHATLTMKVRHDMSNGHGICHGGFIFTLADTAFAFACNSYNQRVVAQQNQITYVAPGQIGDTLTACAHEVSKTGRSGVYDVTVTAPDGTQIALFRGLSRSIKGQHFQEDGAFE